MKSATDTIRRLPFGRCRETPIVLAIATVLSSVAALAFPAGAWGVLEDITPPQVNALSVTPNQVNVKTGPQSVKLPANLSDPAAFGGRSSGVSGACVTYSSPLAGQSNGGCFQRKLPPIATGPYPAAVPGGTLRSDARIITPFGFPAQSPDILVWDEKQNVELADDVSVDIAPPFDGAGAGGTYDGTTELSTSARIPEGTRVSSHFIHNNPAVLNTQRSGCVTFGGKVLGVIVLSHNLNFSEQPNDDSFSSPTTDLGTPNLNYPDTQAEGSSSRGLELDNNNDYVHVSNQRVCVNFNVVDNQDEIRVITDPTSGDYEATVTFPQFAEDGTWKPSLSIFDYAGNSRFYSSQQLETAGFNINVAVESIPDTTPPVISSLSIAPGSVNVSPPNGPQTVTATATITDNLSGLAGASIGFRSPTFNRHSTSGTFVTKTATTGPYPTSLPRGTGRSDTRKIAAPSFSFPAQDPDILVWPEKQNVALGDAVSVDIASNGLYEATGQLSPTPPPIAAGTRVDSHFLHNNPAGLNSERSGCVSFGSKVLGVIILSHNLNGSEEPNDDNFSSTTTTDLGSPFANYPDTQAEGSSSRGLELDNNDDYVLVNTREVCVNFNVLNNQDEIRVITEAVEDQYVAQIQVRPYVEHGTWELTSISLSDRVGNRKNVPGFNDPLPASFDHSFEVVSDPEDFTPPELVAISVEPACEEPGVPGACIDVEDASRTVTVKATITDNLAGVSSASISYSSPSFRHGASAALQRKSGDQFEGTVTLPRFSMAGHWQPTVFLSDGPGNFDSFSSQQLRDAGFDIPIAVTRSRVGTVEPGGEPFSSGDDVDPTNPIQSAVSVAVGGTGGDVALTITPRTTEPPPDFYLLDQQLDITAPAQPDASHPMKIEFRVDSSVFSFNPQVQLPEGCVPGAPPSDCQLTIFRNGVEVPACTAVPPGAIAPDPCVVDPQVQLPDDDRLITVYTTRASIWNVGIDLTQTTNEPPDCSTVTVAPKTLWPPNHKFRLMRLTGGSDPDPLDVLTLEATGVTQDEPLKGKDPGDLAPDARLAGSPARLYLRAERNGNGNGRVYRVGYELSDGKLSCTGTALVSVPRSNNGRPAVDSGGSYNSFGT